jgi:uncharacterized repeat protein (TIGR01451 family)
MSDRRVLRRVRRLLAAAAAVAGALAMTFAGAASPAQAVPGAPGRPQPPTTVFAEDFEHAAGSAVQRLDDYVGVGGQRYTADPAWLSHCNGWVAAADEDLAAPGPVADCLKPLPGDDGRIWWNADQQLAWGIGIFHGASTTVAAHNHAVAAFTSNDQGGPKVEFATAAPIPLSATNRFLGFSVDVAAVNCDVSPPLLQFSLVTPGGTSSPAGAAINACTSPTTETVPAEGVDDARGDLHVGTYTTTGAVLFTGRSIGIRMVNNNPSGEGNDHAFDNIRILDVTPQLDTSFSPATAPAGTTSTLTFTVTNTSELAAKNGWSFSDRLPAGLTVASPSHVRTTCPGGLVIAGTGGSSILATGDLHAGMVSCTLSVNVTSTRAGSYTTRTADTALTGLDAPGPATVTFTKARQPGQLTLVKTPHTIDVDGDGVVGAGDTIVWKFRVTDVGGTTVTDVSVDDPAAGTVTCPATSLAPGASMTCTSQPHVITAAEAASGHIHNVATVGGVGTSRQPVTSSPGQATVTMGERADTSAAGPHSGASSKVGGGGAGSGGAGSGGAGSGRDAVAATGPRTATDLLLAAVFLGVGAILVLVGRERRRPAHRHAESGAHRGSQGLTRADRG